MRIRLLPQHLRLSKRWLQYQAAQSQRLEHAAVVALRACQRDPNPRFWGAMKLAALAATSSALRTSPVPARNGLVAACGTGAVLDLTLLWQSQLCNLAFTRATQCTGTLLTAQFYAHLSVGCGASPQEIDPQASMDATLSFLSRHGVLGIPERVWIDATNACGRRGWWSARKVFLVIAIVYRVPLEAIRAVLLSATLLGQLCVAVVCSAVAVVISALCFVCMRQAKPETYIPFLHHAREQIDASQDAQRWRARWQHVDPTRCGRAGRIQGANEWAAITTAYLHHIAQLTLAASPLSTRDRLISLCTSQQRPDNSFLLPDVFADQLDSIRQQFDAILTRHAHNRRTTLDDEILWRLFGSSHVPQSVRLWEASSFRQVSRCLHPDKLMPLNRPLSGHAHAIATAAFGMVQSVRSVFLANEN